MSTMIPDLELLIEDETDEYEDTDDPLHRTHIVSPPENHSLYSLCIAADIPDPSAQDLVSFARKWGLEVVALCGYKWVPKANPDRYDACEPCFKLAGIYMGAGGE